MNSQGYAQETALSRRVKDWEDKINPELRLQVIRAQAILDLVLSQAKPFINIIFIL